MMKGQSFNRRAFLKSAIAGTAMLGLGGCLGKKSVATANKAHKPNILLIMPDDLGKDWVSCYGGDYKTPNIDKLASAGMRFNNAYSMPQCTPTRLTLLTGQYPYRHGWVNHWDVPRWGHAYYDWKRNPSVARVMKSAGYKNAVAGKWQVNDFEANPDSINKHGFDEWFLWKGGPVNRYWNPVIFSRKGIEKYDDKFGPDMYADFLIDFMKRNRDNPMFIYFPMCLPHGPRINTPDNPNEKGKRRLHKGMVDYCDKILARMVDALERLKIRKNTVIIWTTDNGSAVANSIHGNKVESGKQSLSEMGTCMPFIVNCPGIVPSGVVTDELTDFTDLLPTFAQLGGAKLPAGYTFDGVSIAGLITGKSNESPRKWIMSMGGENRARLTNKGVENEWYFRDRVLRDKRYKLYIGTDRRAEKLVDLKNDPYEIKSKNISENRSPEADKALDKFMKVLENFPEKDNDPRYTNPIPAKVEVSAKSRVWKKGLPGK